MSNFVPVYKPSFIIEEQDDFIAITTEMSKQEKMSSYLGMAFLSLIALGFLCVPPLTLVSHQDKIEGITSFLNLSLYAVILLAVIGYAIFTAFKRTLKHIIKVTGDSLTILEGDYKYYLRPQKYAIEFVKNFRGSTYPNRKEGAVKFDYGSQTIIFGKSLEEAEAHLIVQAIVAKYPNLKAG